MVRKFGRNSHIIIKKPICIFYDIYTEPFIDIQTILIHNHS